jgi:hypothetical protein
MKEQFEILKGWENYIDDFFSITVYDSYVTMLGNHSVAKLNKYLALGFVFKAETNDPYLMLRATKDSIQIILTLNT